MCGSGNRGGRSKVPAPMSVTTEVSKLPESRVKIAVTVDPEEVDGKLQRSAQAFGREMKMPGFRKGKVPAPIVLRQLGREAVMEQALRDSLPQWYEQAIIESGVTPVGEPSLDVPETPDANAALEFSIEIGIRPDAELGDYKGVKVAKAEPAVPDDAIEAEVERVRESLAGLEPVERAAGEGDHLLMDFEGKIDGKPLEGGSATDFLYELGSGSLIEGFDEQLAGAEGGAERTVEVAFPGDYHAEHLAGEDAIFEVTVKEVREKKLPDLDDDFAADNSEFDTLAEWRSDIEDRLSHAVSHRIDDQFREDVVDAVVAGASIDVPEAIASARATELWERIERQLQGSGMDPNAYLQMQGKTRDEAIAEAADDAEQSIRREAVLAAVAEAESIEISDEEMLEALEPPAGEKGKPEKLLKRLRKEGRDVLLTDDLKMRKASDLIVEAAVATEMDPEEAHKRLWSEGEAEEEVEGETEEEVDDAADAGTTSEAPGDEADGGAGEGK